MKKSKTKKVKVIKKVKPVNKKAKPAPKKEKSKPRKVEKKKALSKVASKQAERIEIQKDRNKQVRMESKPSKPFQLKVFSLKDEAPKSFEPVPRKTLPPVAPIQKVVVKPAASKKTPLLNDKDAEKLGTVESAMFDSKMPMNCTVPICGQPAFRKDLDMRMWCEDHRDRGRWK